MFRAHARREVAGGGVLEGDLSVFDERFQHGIGGGEAAFAVREIDAVRLADLEVGKPRAVVVGNDGGGDARDVAADAVVRQRGVARHRCGDFTARQEAAFDERLEAVADAEDEAVACEEGGDGVGDARVGEHVCHVFAGAVRFVACAEAAGEDEDLAVGEVVGKGLQAGVERVAVLVADDGFDDVSAVFAEGARGVEFAVGAGEDGQADARRGDAAHGTWAALCVFGGGERDARGFAYAFVERVHAGECGAGDGVEVFDSGALAVDFEFAAVGGEAEVLQVVGDAEAAVAADEVAAVFGGKAVFELVDVDADAVANRAFVEGLQDAAVAHGADAFDVAFADGLK